MNEVVTVPTDAAPISVPALRREREIRPVCDPVPILDTARFEHMQRVAVAIAKSSMVPNTLAKWKDGEVDKWLEFEAVVSNCFLVVNQAVRWGMDPFAALSCASMVHGKLTFEGKLIAAVLESKLGVELDPVWNDKTGDDFGIVITGRLPSGKVREIEGTVGEWKTTGRGSPWGARASCKRQLLYRGTREWARWWAPGLMLGVYSDDELTDLQDAARANRAALVPSQQEQARQTQTSEPSPSVVGSRADPPKPPSPPATDRRPPSPPKPPSAPVIDNDPPAPADGTAWPDELVAYDSQLSAVEDLNALAEAVELYGARFADAPPEVRAEATKLETSIRESLERAPS